MKEKREKQLKKMYSTKETRNKEKRKEAVLTKKRGGEK
jgi:hypothetical protein